MGLGPPDETDFSQYLRLLVVGGDAQQTARVSELLRDSTSRPDELVVCGSVARMRRALREQTFDCVVLALSDSGPETLDAVLSSVSPDLPVIVLAHPDDPALALRAVQAGAQDYLPEPAPDAGAVRRAVRHAIARKRTEARLARQALHDSLTGLPNRDLMLDRLNVALARARRRPTALAVLFLDLDGFKKVNDGLGHEAGDELLVEVAHRLQSVLRPGDTVARYGGDEFVILCEDLRGQHEAMRVAERARSAIAEPFALRGREVALEASVGIARARRAETTSPPDLIREADVAMYQAKRRGSGVELYEAMDEVEVESRLRDAVERAGLRLHYQPVLVLADDSLHSLEALVRWEHPERGLLAPAEFLTLAEEIGVIGQIDRWVLSEACAELARWRHEGLIDDRLPVSVNLSSRSARSPDLAVAIERALAGAGLPPHCLSLELTEASLERDSARAATVLESLGGSGMRLCLDEFGTDRSTIGAVASHPFDVVKIGVAASARLLETALGAARAAGAQPVAVGIESEAQREAVRELGCDGAQGFLFAPPGPAEEVGRWLASRQ